MGKNMREILARMAAAEAQAKHVSTFQRTIYGIYRPDPNGGGPIHVKNITRKGHRWIETDKPHNVTIPQALEPFITRPKRFNIIIGGRGSGKSDSTGMIMNADVNDDGVKVMNLREFQAAIKYSVHPLLCQMIERSGYSGFIPLRDEIRHVNGGLHMFKGMARDPDGLKSAFGFKRFWGEEAQTFSEESLRKLTPTMREEGGYMVFTANPGSSEDPFSKRFITPFIEELDKRGIYEDDLHLVIRVNYDANPWFPSSLRAEMEYDRKTLSRALFDHIWKGAFNDSVPDAIIPAEWFDACIDAHIKLGFKPSGKIITALDPADVGEDNKAFIARHGSVVTFARSWFEGDANDSADIAISESKKIGADCVIWDRAGLGSGLRRQFTDAYDNTPVMVEGYNAGEGVKRPDGPVELDKWIDNASLGKNTAKNIDTFANRGSQDIYLLRRRMEKTYRAVELGEYINPDELLSLSSEGIGEFMPQLRAELCRIPRIYNANGKFSRMPKPDMRKKLKIKSPGMADALIMTMQPPEKQLQKSYDDYRVPGNY